MYKISLIFCLSLLSFCVFAQSGKVYDEVSLPSKILNSERKFAIYLPPDYETSTRKYPILYLLHGSGDDQTGWIQFGEVLHITDQSIREGKATPMIIVMPDANTGQKGYANIPNSNWRYEDFFFEELMPFVEKKYRVKAEKRFRAVAGLSMGGWGSFVYALHRPELFSSVCPLSATVGPLSLTQTKEWLNFLKVKDLKDDELEAFYQKYSALALLESIKEENKKALRWYIDCGDDDFLFEGNSLVHIIMRKKDIPHEFRIRNGGHTWTYWREALPQVLTFVSEAFHQY